jgi:ElaB/YqjD/DUF883 family membrane-anchored ribosome-binding protein
MARPALDSMTAEELKQLIDDAQRLLAEKFEGNRGEWADKLRSQADDAHAVERKADPFRSPTA